MAEHLDIPAGNKEQIYQALLPQIKALIGEETDTIANMANVAAALKQAFGFFWVGFYLVKDDQLVLGPFQGPVACTRIRYGKGVCGTAWKEEKIILVQDVNKFPGHIACSSESKSEIVVPLFHSKRPVAVLDVDSDRPNDFNETDAKYLEAICRLL
ncbi:GAF domain-containing protein [Parabacteroides sp. Marseille-P3160]|uniref:GAF domain-containing protein n=1 Tax=Parabacteroides sp. Marseille-P3160 TaxID=1917887 RepID=UPI0009BC509A|nr:GAF domain-containing protein [Parabacteroides sp. Marseille-P3160]